MLRNDASKLRARRSPSGAVQRLNAATSSGAASRRRRLSDALAVASVAAAFVCGSLGVSDAYAQRAQSAHPAQSNATAKTPLFSGKFARNVSEKFSREAETQNRGAARRSPQTSERGAANARPNSSAASAATASSATRASSTRRPPNAPARGAAPGYNATRSGGARSAPSANAAASAEALAQPSTSRESAQEAFAKIPWQALSPAAREKLVELAKNPTMYRRLPMAGGYCNPELFDFFLTHPHAVVGLWRQMGYDDVSMTQIGPNLYSIREKTGTVGRAQILYQDDDLTLVYCSGKYQGPVVPRALDGEMFLVLQTRYTEDPTGRPIVVCRLDAFVDLKNAGADLLARTFSGALGKLADSNFEQTLAFIDSVSQAAETNPGSLSGSIVGLSELSPEARRLFAAKTSEIARQAQLRARGTYVDYQLLPKLNSPTPTVARILSRERAGTATNAAVAARSQNAASYPASGAALGAESRPTARESFAADATTARAGSAFSGASTLGANGSTGGSFGSSFNDFDEPSLARNSFALSDDSADDYDFESELDWEEDEEPLKVGGARVAPQPKSALGAATAPLVPETSVAKATARPATRFSDALDLVEPSATAGDADAPATPATLATDDDSPIAANDAPLLLDFETGLLEDDEEVALDDAASTVAKPAPLVAFPTTQAADAIALPSVATNAAQVDEATQEPELPILVFDETPSDASNETPNNAANVSTPDETTALDDVPLLFLPGDDAANAPQAPQTSALPPARSTPKVALTPDLAPPKARGRVVAPIVPNAKTAKKPANAQTPRPTEKPAPAVDAPKQDAPKPVWRAVDAKSARAQVAPPIAETARAATEKGGATFRKPEIH